MDISRNFLTGFDEDLAEKLLSIENIHFERNKIVCDVCSVGALVDRKHLVRNELTNSLDIELHKFIMSFIHI